MGSVTHQKAQDHPPGSLLQPKLAIRELCGKDSVTHTKAQDHPQDYSTNGFQFAAAAAAAVKLLTPPFSQASGILPPHARSNH